MPPRAAPRGSCAHAPSVRCPPLAVPAAPSAPSAPSAQHCLAAVLPRHLPSRIALLLQLVALLLSKIASSRLSCEHFDDHVPQHPVSVVAGRRPLLQPSNQSLSVLVDRWLLFLGHSSCDTQSIQRPSSSDNFRLPLLQQSVLLPMVLCARALRGSSPSPGALPDVVGLARTSRARSSDSDTRVLDGPLALSQLLQLLSMPRV